METFFDDLEQRAAFLAELFDGGRQDEALTLCCCYIDGLGGLLYGRSCTGSARNFSRILREHGGERELDLISPLGLVRYLEFVNVYWLGRWAYAERMPLVLGVGVTPLLQWVLVPPLPLWLARRYLGP